MDITLQIMAFPASHDLSYDPGKDARRYARGDVLDVMLSSTVADLVNQNYIFKEPITSSRTIFAHIKDVPVAAVKKLKNKLTEPHDQNEKTINAITLLRKRWGVNVSTIPAGIRNKWIADKEITFTWTQVKNYLRHKADNRLIADADIA